METNIREVSFSSSYTEHLYGFAQYDRGQKLKITGIETDANTEVHFSLSASGGESPRVLPDSTGTETIVSVPDFVFCADRTYDYEAYAFVYYADVNVGKTERRIIMHIKSRPKHADFAPPSEPDLTQKILQELSTKLTAPSSAQIGQIFRVQSINEDGTLVLEAVDMPSGVLGQIDDISISLEKTWSSQKISDELDECVKFVKIAINLIGSEGNIPLGNTVYVYEIVNEIETLSYSVLCPDGTITVRVPHGIHYRITASTDAEGFYAPTEVMGVAINDSEATIRYTELAYPKTIRDLQTLAKIGLASDVVAIGDEFMTTYTYDGSEFEMPWIVTDIKEVEFEDGSTGQGVFLESKYCTIESLQFDAPHQELATEETAIEGLYYIGRTDNTYTLLALSAGDAIPYSDYTYIYHDTIRDTSLNIYRYGHDRVLTSALRQWLNSDADKGQWWIAPKVGYCSPSQLNSQKGFMAGLPQEFLDCVAKVKRTYYTNSVTDGSVIDVLYDKFFTATGTELYGSVNENEGTYFPYYKEVTGLSAPSNSQNTGRIKYALNAKTSSQGCWSFSSNRGGSCSAWIRNATGQLGSSNALNSYRAVPACVIG